MYIKILINIPIVPHKHIYIYIYIYITGWSLQNHTKQAMNEVFLGVTSLSSKKMKYMKRRGSKKPTTHIWLLIEQTMFFAH